MARFVADLMAEPTYESKPWVNTLITASGEICSDADPGVRIEMRAYGGFEIKKMKAKPKAHDP